MGVCVSPVITLTHHCARRATREEMAYYLHNCIWSLEFRGLTLLQRSSVKYFSGCRWVQVASGSGFTIKVMAHRSAYGWFNVMETRLFTKEPQILEMKLCRSLNTQRDMEGVREQLNGTRTPFPVICSSVNGISFQHRRTDQWMFVFPQRSQSLITAQDEQREKRRRTTCIITSGV
ncbi:hypothetical protein CDAR_541401 [Caerostris darwini]|uniref:Uncharacterized protein n=1 Tax=Caerostris darwini TaxID=1538125 RepID=A0AAV4VXD2_9ARAC|nr:hypothetical protein CDAR_541401 [Caerostris darwini]